MRDDRIFDAAFIYLFIENAETISQPRLVICYFKRHYFESEGRGPDLRKWRGPRMVALHLWRRSYACAVYYAVVVCLSARPSVCLLLTLFLTLCGLTSQKTHRGGLGLGGSAHEEAHPCFPCFIQPSFKSTDAGSIYHPLFQLIPSINHSVWKNTYSSPVCTEI